MTKAQIKLIQSLSRQKYRKEYNAYLVEGDKNAKEWLYADCPIQYIVSTTSWIEENKEIIDRHPEAQLLVAEAFELDKMTALQTAQAAILVVQKPTVFQYTPIEGQWALYLEKIQDPGNMGTIIRTADWFGISQIICSPDCVEVFNPKVVQASMGSLLRVGITEMDLESFLAVKNTPLYAASLEGQDMRDITKTRGGIIAMGNESQGLSQTIQDAAEFKIKIPGGNSGAESLNVAVAAGVLCAALTL